ncbi:MAG: T9SS type A sorting domain-containing protein [Bacteroidales bacterium]
MKLQTFLPFVLFLLLVSSLGLSAQEAITAAGGSCSGSGGTSCFSLGQIACNTLSGSGFTLLQGVQQPYQVDVSNSEGVSGISKSITVFPNPTGGKLFLTIEGTLPAGLFCRLYDLQGNLLFQKPLNENLCTVEMEMLPSATYLVEIREKERILKSFKIIKK